MILFDIGITTLLVINGKFYVLTMSSILARVERVKERDTLNNNKLEKVTIQIQTQHHVAIIHNIITK